MKQSRLSHGDFQKKLPIYASVFAVLALILTLGLLFGPKLMESIQTDQNPIKNPDAPTPGNQNKAEALFDRIPDPQLPTAVLPGLSVDGISLSAENDALPLSALPADAALSLHTVIGADGSYPSPDEISAMIQVVPATALSVTARGRDGFFRIAPASGTWQDDTLYALTMGTPDNPVYSCAFQTSHTFSVRQVYPADRALGVSSASGMELTFTDTVRDADFASYITVEPPIKGAFSLYPDGKTAVIIPDEPLALNTEYTITVRAGLTADNGAVLKDGLVSRFRTEPEHVTPDPAAPGLSLWIDENDLLFSPGTTMQIPYHMMAVPSSAASARFEKLQLRIYQYASAADAAEMILSFEKNEQADWYYNGTGRRCPTDKLITVYHDIPAQFVTEHSSGIQDGILMLPVLSAGTYLCEITGTCEIGSEQTASSVIQAFLQVSPLRAYTESADGSTLLWVNRTDTGSPAAGAFAEAVTYVPNGFWSAPEHERENRFIRHSMTLAPDGTAEFSDTTAEHALILIEDSGTTLLVPAVNETKSQFDAPRIFVYTDREVYFSDDTVNLFGVLGRCYTGQKLPDTLLLYVGSQSVGTPVSVAENGTFRCSFPIEAWTAGGLSYRLQSPDGHPLFFDFVSVTQTEKPVYDLSLSYDSLYYTYQQEAELQVQVSFFDGTPAAGVTVTVETEPFHVRKEIVTDAFGCGTLTYRLGTPGDLRQNSTDAILLRASAGISGYETSVQTADAEAYYLHSGAVIRTDYPDAGHIGYYLYECITRNLHSPADFRYTAYPDNTCGNPMTDLVEVVLQKTTYKRIVTGTYYNPLTKTTEETCRYEPETITEDFYAKQVSGGALFLDRIEPKEEHCFYTYKISWVDPKSLHTYTESIYANQGSDYSYTFDPEEEKRFTLDVTGKAVLSHEEDSSVYAAIGDTVTAYVRDSGRLLNPKQTPALLTFYAGRDGRISKLCSNTFAFTFGEEHALSASVLATVFDGESYVELPPVPVRYDYAKENWLDIRLKTDKKSYRPGETAKISVSVPDAPGGSVLVSLVDEACFSLGDQIVSPLYAYFETTQRTDQGYLWHIARNERFAWVDPGLSPYGSDSFNETTEAETIVSPTGINTYIRKTFEDNPMFAVLPLDADGKAETTFRVPDNLTTWRITALAVSGTGRDAQADAFTSGAKLGTAVSETVCSLPYFVSLTMPSLLLTEDEIAFSVRSYGTILSQLSRYTDVSYIAELSDDTGSILMTQEQSGVIGDFTWFALPPLTPGSYSVTVTGVCGTHSDAVRSSFLVTDTAAVMPVLRTVSPDQLSSLSVTAFPLELTFRDRTTDTLLAVIERLSQAGSARSDTLAASAAAQTAYKKLAGPAEPLWYAGLYNGIGIPGLSAYAGKLLPLLPHGEGDPILTAKVLYCTPDALTEEERALLVPVFEQILTEGLYADETEYTACLLALAALGEPILDDLYACAAVAGAYPTDAKLLLSAAFAAAGDFSASKAAWNAVITPLGRTMTDQTFCISDASTEEAIRLTALGLLTASRIDRPLAEKMIGYLFSHSSSTDPYVLEFASYLTYFRPTSAAKQSFSYRIGDKTTDITLSAGECCTLTLTKSEWENLQIIHADAAVTVSAVYGGTPAEAIRGTVTEKEFKLQKTITPAETPGFFRVTLAYEGLTDKDSTVFLLSDCVPAGARYVMTEPQRSNAENSSVFLSEAAGQQLSGSVRIFNRERTSENRLEGAKPYAFSGSVSYLIRGAVKGHFTAEPAYAVSRDSGLYTMTSRYHITIKDETWEIS